jgi:putative transposase
MDAELPVTTQTNLLSLNRTSLYYTPVARAPQEVALKHWSDAIYTDHPYDGVRRISAQLRREAVLVNHKAVDRHMREMGLAGICPGPTRSKPAHQAGIYPYLLRDVSAERPNHIWGIAITYIRLRGGWMYLVAVIDWFSRYVVSGDWLRAWPKRS